MAQKHTFKRKGWFAFSKRKRGFTLIEVLIAISIIGIFGAVSGVIFSSVIRSYNKTQITIELEQNGNYVLSILEQQIRNAKDVRKSGSQEIEITPQTGDLVRYGFVAGGSGSNGYIYKIVEGKNVPMTNQNPISGVNVVSCLFSVYRPNPSSPKMVTTTLVVEQGKNAPQKKDYVGEVRLTSTVALRGGYE